jgi:hypothetical protein
MTGGWTGSGGAGCDETGTCGGAGVGFGRGAGVGFGRGAGVGFGRGAGVGFGRGAGVGLRLGCDHGLGPTGAPRLIRRPTRCAGAGKWNGGVTPGAAFAAYVPPLTDNTAPRSSSTGDTRELGFNATIVSNCIVPKVRGKTVKRRRTNCAPPAAMARCRRKAARG